MNILRRHKGVTLLEILIVIVIIGIISSSMYLSVLNMSASADANKIINDMMALKQATLLWYKENLSRITYDSKNGCKITTNGTKQNLDEFVRDHKAEILKHLDNASSIKLYSTKLNSGEVNNTGDYALVAKDNNKKWYICCNTGTTYYIIRDHGNESPELEVKKKLAGRAKGLGLLGMVTITDTNFTGTYTDQKFACMLVLDLS